MKLKLETPEVRPCYVKKRKALFHKWSQKDVGTHIADVAIIEYENGVVATCSPREIRFIDYKISEYAFNYDFDETKVRRNMNYEAKGYRLTGKPTGRIMFMCLDCKTHMVYIANRSDGRTCYKCNGHITPIGYAVKEESNEFK